MEMYVLGLLSRMSVETYTKCLTNPVVLSEHQLRCDTSDASWRNPAQFSFRSILLLTVQPPNTSDTEPDSLSVDWEPA